MKTSFYERAMVRSDDRWRLWPAAVVGLPALIALVGLSVLGWRLFGVWPALIALAAAVPTYLIVR